MAIYTKALYSGIGAMAVYTGDNIDEVIAAVGAENVEVRGSRLYVHGERIAIGDAACMTDDVTPAPHPKIAARTLHADNWQIEAVVYDGTNVDAVRALVGNSNVEFRSSTLYVDGTEVASGDAVALCHELLVPPIAAAALASDYTLVT